MGNIILPGDEACPSCSHDAILVLLCPCLAELWQFKVMSADGPTSGRDSGPRKLVWGQVQLANTTMSILSFSPSNWMSFLSILPSIVALRDWNSTLGKAFPEFFLGLSS